MVETTKELTIQEWANKMKMSPEAMLKAANLPQRDPQETLSSEEEKLKLLHWARSKNSRRTQGKRYSYNPLSASVDKIQGRAQRPIQIKIRGQRKRGEPKSSEFRSDAETRLSHERAQELARRRRQQEMQNIGTIPDSSKSITAKLIKPAAAANKKTAAAAEAKTAAPSTAAAPESIAIPASPSGPSSAPAATVGTGGQALHGKKAAPAAGVAKRVTSSSGSAAGVETDTTPGKGKKGRGDGGHSGKSTSRASVIRQKMRNEELLSQENWDGELALSGETVQQQGGQGKSGLHSAVARALKSQHKFHKPKQEKPREIELPPQLSLNELAKRLSVRVQVVASQLASLGFNADTNTTLDQDVATFVVEEMGHKVSLLENIDPEDALLQQMQKDDDLGKPIPRPPVVVVMGHVDHGKTTLLDYIRKSQVASQEAGNITQHMGAYSAATDHGSITFIDTPGHEAFTQMRARGASCTDIAVLVVAADEGVKQQTIEAIQHANSAEIPIIVAVNRMDLPDADPEKVRTGLSAEGVVSEEWGGHSIFVQLSALTGEGVPQLLEAISLQAEIMELKAPSTGRASGTVIESHLDKGRGRFVSAIISEGTLEANDVIVCGSSYGRARRLLDDKGGTIKSAGPSTPVSVLGLADSPEAGDSLIVCKREQDARALVDLRRQKKQKNLQSSSRESDAEQLFANWGKEEKNVLNLIVKADVAGSLEALGQSLENLSNDEVEVRILFRGLGAITASDAQLAVTSKALILGFHVRTDAQSRRIIDAQGIKVIYHSLIYQAIEAIEALVQDLIVPPEVEKIIGIAEVKEVFRSSRFGSVAGSQVVQGSVRKDLPIRVLRDDVVIFTGALESLRRFKDDVREVRSGSECGIAVRNYKDVQVGDKIEVFEVVNQPAAR